MTKTRGFDFGSGPDSCLAYRWDTKRELFRLREVCALPRAILLLKPLMIVISIVFYGFGTNIEDCLFFFLCWLIATSKAMAFSLGRLDRLCLSLHCKFSHSLLFDVLILIMPPPTKSPQACFQVVRRSMIPF